MFPHLNSMNYVFNWFLYFSSLNLGIIVFFFKSEDISKIRSNLIVIINSIILETYAVSTYIVLKFLTWNPLYRYSLWQNKFIFTCISYTLFRRPFFWDIKKSFKKYTYRIQLQLRNVLINKYSLTMFPELHGKFQR